jgi:nucleoside triphosphatase
MKKNPEPTVGAVIFNGGKILLCKSKKWNNKYVIPGGHIEIGERMEDALRREILEETGLVIYDISPLGVQEFINDESFHEDKHFIFIDFICRTDTRKVDLNEESESYCWISLDEIENYELGGYTSDLLQEIKNGNSSSHKREMLYNYAMIRHSKE